MAGTSPAMTTRVSTAMAPNRSDLFAPRGTPDEIETGTLFQPRFDADGLIPAIVTDAASGEVLMFAWMNAEALSLTLQTQLGHFWSRSRGKLWKKGEESGNLLRVIEVRTDCDQDVAVAQGDRRGRRPRLPHRRALLLLPHPAARPAGRLPICTPNATSASSSRRHRCAYTTCRAWHASQHAVNSCVAVT